jgi:prophage maintenance system killer protein
MSITVGLVLGHHTMMLQDAPGREGVYLEKLENIIVQSNNSHNCFKNAAIFTYRVINEKPFYTFNKRVAMAMIGDYLEESKFEFTASSLEALQFVNDIENGLSLDQIEAFITENSKPL